MWVELIFFNIFVLLMLLLDLGVFHKKSHEIKMKEALLWSLFWIGLSFVFALGIFYWEGHEKGLQFVAAYLVEKSLSADNIFVFLIIFTYFKISPITQHKILFWGIIGALVMRAIFIAAGITLISYFHWVIYPLALLLLFLGIKITFRKDEEIHPEKNPVFLFIKKYVPLVENYEGTKFFIKQAGKWVATPLFVVLAIIETTDIVFAVDSIPAVLAITLDPFIVYTSNVMAILGLRALYFALAAIMPLFRFLHIGLGIILVFVGLKMLMSEFFPIPVEYSLLIILFILATSIIFSLAIRKKT